MCHKRLQYAVVLPGEVENDKRLFVQVPIRVIQKYLEYFGDDGHLCIDGAPHVLEALAKIFALYMNGLHPSLEAAFGGGCNRQRKSINEELKDERVVYDMILQIREAKGLSKLERAGSTPFELAVAKVADAHKLGEENVRRIYKKSAGKPSKKPSKAACAPK